MAIAFIDAFSILAPGYGYWRMPDVFAPSLVFGVRVPPGHADDPAIGRGAAPYRAVLVLLTIVGIIASLLWRSGWPLYSALLPVGFIIVLFIDFYVAHRTVQAVKEAGRWYEGLREASVATRRRGSRRSPIRSASSSRR